MIKLLKLSNTQEFKFVTRQYLSLIAFGTLWSSPCKNQHKILMNLMKKYSAIITIARVDVENHPDIAEKGNIQTVPTLIIYHKNKEIKRLVGLQSLSTLQTSLSEMEHLVIESHSDSESDTGLPLTPNRFN
jgi:thioredoxin-like negative regulator of GroEL